MYDIEVCIRFENIKYCKICIYILFQFAKDAKFPIKFLAFSGAPAIQDIMNGGIESIKIVKQ